ncbi:MAG: hypothetical protein IVW56_05720 [Candidatus Binataceae bacterium]|nr:hypothetical protein [Candidatus Binataceae bacterium]
MLPAGAFGWVRHAVRDPGPDFPRFGLGRRVLYIRRDLAPRATAIFAALARLAAYPPATAGRGNRASGFRLPLDGGSEIFARVGRRGGLIGRLLSDLYLGVTPRPVRELAVANEARLRGIPIAEPLGAMVETVVPGLYRGTFLTRAMAGMTLWEFLRTDDDPLVRTHVIGHARGAIDTMHRGGLLHADLNLHNLFVTQAGDQFSVVILDLDKARLFPAPIAPARRHGNLARLARSARKLDPDGACLDPRMIAMLTAP